MENENLICEVCEKQDETVTVIVDPVYRIVVIHMCDECNNIKYDKYIESFYG